MPACFTLTKNGCNEPSSFQSIDEEICRMLGVPCDPEWFCLRWYDLIGSCLACGRDWSYIVDLISPGDLEDLKLLAICAYLQANYTANCWSER